MPKEHLIQFARFVAVGLLNTLVGYSIYAGLALSGLSASHALIMTYSIAVPLNFLSTGKLVFDSSSLRPLVRFVIVYIFIFLINWKALALAMDAGLGKLLAQAVIVPFVAVLSFLVFKHVVFRGG